MIRTLGVWKSIHPAGSVKVLRQSRGGHRRRYACRSIWGIGLRATRKREVSMAV